MASEWQVFGFWEDDSLVELPFVVGFLKDTGLAVEGEILSFNIGDRVPKKIIDIMGVSV